MNVPAKPFDEWTTQDHEIASLKRTIDTLEKENYHIKEYIIRQEKQLNSLQNRTGWDKFNDSLLTLGEHRIDDAINKLLKQRELYNQGLKRDPGVPGVPRFQPEVTGRRRSTTLPTAQTQPDIKQRKRALRRVDSVAALAVRFSSLFKKNKKVRDKDKVREDNIVEEDGESVEEGVVERAKETVMKEWEERERLDEEYEQLLVEEQKFPRERPKHPCYANMADHEQAKGWKLEKAQEEYRKSRENRKKRVYPVRKSSVRVVNEHQRMGKESKEVEEELVAAMEKEYAASLPSRGTSIRTVHWPEGSRLTGSIFEGAQVLPPPLPTISTRLATAHTIPNQEFLPQPPQPTRPPPAIPHTSRLRKRQTHQPTAPPARRAAESDDVFSRPSRPATPPSQAAELPRVRRLKKRRSEPSPTPRFVSYRPASPSPGGNGPVGPDPMPSWLRRREGSRDLKSMMAGECED